jgi:hypothetical protein
MATGLKRPLKPQTAVLNNSSLTRGLVFDTLITERGRGRPQDKAGKLRGTFTGTPTPNNDLYGMNLTFAAATDVIAFTPPTVSKVHGMTKFTYEALVNMTGLGGGSLGYVVVKSNSGPPYFVLNAKAASTMQVLTGFATTQGNWSFPVTQSKWQHIVARVTMDTTTTPTVWVDGVKQTLTLITAASGAAPTDNANLFIGNNSAGTRNWAGQIDYVRAWNRYLTDKEVAQLNVNPWAIYKTIDMLVAR